MYSVESGSLNASMETPGVLGARCATGPEREATRSSELRVSQGRRSCVTPTPWLFHPTSQCRSYSRWSVELTNTVVGVTGKWRR